MTPKAARFLERICAEPDDDGPRLIFADWLDDRDDPRGEFIRVQIALARLPADDPRRPQLLDREATLLARHHAAWSAPLRGWTGQPTFHRGFVETIIVDARTFIRRGDVLFRLAPVRHAWFVDIGSSLATLMASPHLARLSAMTIFAHHMNESLTRGLVDSPFLGGLRSLNIGRNRVGDRGADRLACSPQFQRLVELDLSDNAIGDTGAQALADSRNLGELIALELRRNELSRAGLGSFCRSTALTSLRRLGLGLNYVGAERDSPPPSAGAVRLASLDLSENGLGPGGIEQLTTLPGLNDLARLTLNRNEIGNNGASMLANWSTMASLQSLALAGNRVGDGGARDLARSPYLFRLSELDLSDNPIHDSGAFELLNTPSLPRLRRLGLPHLGLTPQMREALMRGTPADNRAFWTATFSVPVRKPRHCPASYFFRTCPKTAALPCFLWQQASRPVRFHRPGGLLPQKQ